jgi:exodeoxyribonuclease V gamma subunit
MFRLYYSNRLEDLLAPLAESVREQQARAPLEPVTIVVPGRAMAQYVKFELAERLGVAANLHFPFLHDYLAGLVRKVDPGLDLLNRRRLELLLYHRLGTGGMNDAPEMAPVRSYLEPAADRSDRNLRRLQLARELSGLFLEYAFSRRDLLAGWKNGFVLAGTPYEEPERWQRMLWLSIFDHRGALPGASGSSISKWQLLPDAFDEIPPEKLAAASPLHLFGLSYLAPVFPSIFRRLAARGDVAMYSAIPCLEFPEDGERFGAHGSEGWAPATAGPSDGSGPDPYGLRREGENRAVALWATPGRESFRIVNAICDPERHPCFAPQAAGAEPTLLRRIQDDILRRAPEDSIRRRAPCNPDESIRFLACPGIRREAEMVAGKIWSIIASSPQRGPERLRFHEIAVVLPEGAEADYVPHVNAAFRELRGIPVDLPPSSLLPGTRLVEAVEGLLALPLGRFTREEMIRLLAHPSVGQGAGERDRARWSEWSDDLHVVFGADRTDLAGTFIHPRDLYNWDQGLRRLALGVFMAGEPSGFHEIYGEGDNACIPLEVPQGEFHVAARFLSLARRLISDARSCAKDERRPSEWAKALAQLVRTYIFPSNEADFALRQACIDAISEIGVELDPEPISYEVAHELATDAMSDVRSRAVHLTRRGVAVGTLRSIRAVPFRVIFLMGLGEGLFPARERADKLDLRLADRRAGDASPGERDRYLFLETLLAARDRLFLSYVARDPRTGEALEPSTVIRELQFLLGDYADPRTIEAMTEKFPVTRYVANLATAGRTPDAGPPGVDLAALRGGRFRTLGEDLRHHLTGSAPPDRETILLGVSRMRDPAVRERVLSGLRLPKLPDPPPRGTERRRIDVPLAGLRKFLECPLQGAARYALRIFEDDFGETEAEEPLEGSILARTVLARDAFRDHAGDPGAASKAFLEAHERAVLLGTAPAGPFGEAERNSIREMMGNWSKNARRFGLEDLSDWGCVQIGRANERAVVRKSLPPIVIENLEVPCTGGGVEKIDVYLSGATELLSPDCAAAIRCVLRKKVKEYDYLPLYFTAIALAAAGEWTENSFRGVILPGDDPRKVNSERWMSAMTRQEARDYLGALVSDLFSGSHAYFLPFEAAMKVRPVLDRSGVAIVPLLDELRLDEWEKCRSDYGPVRVPRRFPPPPEKEARRIVERRFGPLFARMLPEAPGRGKRS